MIRSTALQRGAEVYPRPARLATDEALVVDYGRQLLRDKRVSPETFRRAHERFGDQGLVDLTALLGYYSMIACALNAFELQPAEGAAKLP